MSIRTFTQTAELQGISVYYVPVDWDDVAPEDALFNVPHGSARGLLIGYIGDNVYYQQLCDALKRIGIEMINSPEQSETAQEFEKFYPLVSDLTAGSVIVSSSDDIERAIEMVGFPMFVKGGIKSIKEEGWSACTVDDAPSLRQKFEYFKQRPILARSKMVVREILPLRRSGEMIGGFPESREYRVFSVFGEPIDYGYYWRESDPFGPLTADERSGLLQIARAAARRVACPLMTVDVAQVETGEWLVIEVGDLQFSGINQMNVLRFWDRLRQLLNSTDDA